MTKSLQGIAFFLFAITTQLASAEAPRINSAAWLKNGCESLKHMAESEKWPEGNEAAAAGMQVQVWLNGYIVGVNSMCLSKDPSPDITYPPDKWTDGRIIAPMILEFLKQNPKIPLTAKARSVVTAWYYSAHPKATAEHKRLSKAIVDDMINNPFGDN